MSFSKNLSVVVLAAGKGKRMKSEIPKVLHQICGKPMLYYILSLAGKYICSYRLQERAGQRLYKNQLPGSQNYYSEGPAGYCSCCFYVEETKRGSWEEYINTSR